MIKLGKIKKTIICILASGLIFAPVTAFAESETVNETNGKAVAEAILAKTNLPEDTTVAITEDGVVTQAQILNINITNDITEPTNLPVDIVEKILPKSLKGCGETLCEGEAEYGVNMLFILGIAKQETSSGTAGVGATKNNLFGVKGGGEGFKSFSSFNESIENEFRMLRERYIDRGRTTITSISQIYCVPPEHWANAVSNNFSNYIEIAKEAVDETLDDNYNYIYQSDIEE